MSLCVTVAWGGGKSGPCGCPPISLLLITLKAPIAFLQSERPPSAARVKDGGLILSIKLSFQESIRWAQGVLLEIIGFLQTAHGGLETVIFHNP